MASSKARSVLDLPVLCKCVIVGNSGVGKTAYISRILTDIYDQSYKPTLQSQTYPVYIGGISRVDLIDTTALVKRQHLRNAIYGQGESVIIMSTFTAEGKPDLTSPVEWHKQLRAVLPTAPIVVLVNKHDYRPRYTSPETITLNGETVPIKYISVKADTKSSLLEHVRNLTNLVDVHEQ